MTSKAASRFKVNKCARMYTRSCVPLSHGCTALHSSLTPQYKSLRFVGPLPGSNSKAAAPLTTPTYMRSGGFKSNRAIKTLSQQRLSPRTELLKVQQQAVLLLQHSTCQHGARPYTTNRDMQTGDTQLTQSGKQRGTTAQCCGHVSCRRRTWGREMRGGAQRKHAPVKQGCRHMPKPSIQGLVLPIVQATY